MTRRFLIGSLAMVTAIGCGRSEQQQAEDAARQIEQGAATMQQGAEAMAQGAGDASEQMTQGLQQLAQGFQQMAQGSADPVDYETLKALLPDISGWTQSDARGEQLSMPMKYSRAEARYTRDGGRVELEIVDSALSQMLLAPMTMFLATGYSERSDEGFKRSAAIGSHPGFEEWRAASKHGEVTALVNKRFIVKASGDGVEDIAAIRQVVESVDMARLAALK